MNFLKPISLLLPLFIFITCSSAFAESSPQQAADFKKACDNKDVSACNNLGILYYKGEGIEKDYFKAAELYKTACDLKEASACGNLGGLYANGEGVKQDDEMALKYLGLACDMQDQKGCENYAKLKKNQPTKK